MSGWRGSSMRVRRSLRSKIAPRYWVRTELRVGTIYRRIPGRTRDHFQDGVRNMAPSPAVTRNCFPSRTLVLLQILGFLARPRTHLLPERLRGISMECLHPICHRVCRSEGESTFLLSVVNVNNLFRYRIRVSHRLWSKYFGQYPYLFPVHFSGS